MNRSREEVIGLLIGAIAIGVLVALALLLRKLS